VDEVRAARILALAGIAAYDAGIACTDAKYHYWLVRPTQADSTIGLADRLTLPNFPSYPSGHACLSGAIAETFGHFLPEVRAEVTRLAEEAAMSRLYAGVHYRFDNDVGLELGRQVARVVIAEDSAGRLMARLR
jgi:membrane-associated phospholipid phosphatase